MSRQNISILSLSVRATTAVLPDRFVTSLGAYPAAGNNTLGVSASSAAIGDLFTTEVCGTSYVEASAAIALGAAIESLVDGRAVTKTTGITVARALQQATAAGQLIEVFTH